MEEISIAYIWLLVGVLFLMIEAFGFPGTGLMFAGLGALTTGAALYAHILDESSTSIQFIVFFLASALWAAALWKPLQQLRLSKRKNEYRNIVGDTAYVGSQGLSRHGGEVTWSGTIMKARLADNTSVDRLEPGSEVVITEVTGATLIVQPKS